MVLKRIVKKPRVFCGGENIHLAEVIIAPIKFLSLKKKKLIAAGS
jgi:hypothetical protein